MKDHDKTKEQLINELVELRQRVAELEATETEHKRAEEEIRQRNRELAALNAITTVVSQSLDLDEILNAALDKVLELTRLGVGGIYLADPVRRKLDLVVHRGVSEEFANEIGSVSVDEKTLEAVTAEGKLRRFILLVEAVVKDQAELKRIVSAMKKEGLSLASGVPALLQAKEEILGLMIVANRVPRQFSEAELQLLTSIGQQIAIAIENARLYEAVQQELAERKRAEEALGRERDLAEALTEAAAVVSSTLDPDQVLDRILEQVSRVVPSDATNVMLIEGDQARIVRWRGYERFGAEEFISTVVFRIPELPNLQQMMASGEPMVIPDTAAYPGWVRMTVTGWLRSYAAAPIIVRGEVIGFLNVDSATPGFFTQAHAETLRAFADHAAAAIENARLHQETTRTKDYLQSVLDSSIDLIFTVRPDGTFGYFNPRLTEITGYQAGAIRGRPFLDFIPEDRQAFMLQKWEEITQGIGGTYETEILDAHGRRLPVLVSHSVIEGFDEYLAILRDISDIKAAEQKILQRAGRLAAINRVSAAVSSTLDLNEILNAITQQMAELFAVEHSGILMFDEKKECGYVLAEYPDWGATAERFEVKGYLAAERVIADQKPLMIEDTLKDPLMTKVRDTMRRLGIKSMLIVPLLVKDETIGSIGLDVIKEPRVFSQEEIELAQTIANQAAIAIENARLFEETQRRAEQMAALSQVNMALTSTLERDQILGMVLDQLKTILDYDSATIQTLLGPYTVGVAAARPPSHDEELRKGFDASQNPLFYEMKDERKAVVIDDVHLDDRWAKIGDWERVRSWVGVPLFARDNFLGFLNVEKGIPGFYREADVQLLRDFAQGAALAIANARLFEEEARRITQLRAISEVAKDIASILDLDKLLHRVVELLVAAFGYYYANVLMVDKEAQEIVLTATAGQTGRAFEGLRLKIGKQGITGWVAGSGEPLLVNDVDKEPCYYSVEELADTKSELAVPIKLKGEVIGVMDVQSVEQDAFDEMDLSTLTTLADQLAGAIENVRLFEEEQRRAAQLAVVNEVGRHAASTLELDQILHQVTTAIHTGFGYYNMATLLVEGEYAVLKAIAGGFAEEVKDGYRQHLSQGIIGWCINHAQAVLANDVSRDPRFIPGFLEKVLTQSELCVPIRVDGKVIGALDVQSTELNAFDQWDVRALETLSDQMALAVKNALTYGRLDEEKGRLELLYQVAAEVNRSLDLDEILAQAIEGITARLGGKVGYVFLVEPGTDRLQLRAVSGVEVPIAELNEVLDVHVGQGLVGWVAAHREAAVVDDVTQDERWLYVDELDRGIRSVMSVPLVRGEETLGVLSVLHPRPGFFDEEQCRLLMAIAQQVAVAVANARLHETVQEQAMLDSLTQVYNHGELIRRLHVAVEEGAREDQPVSYIMLDIDYFKEYNDRYGHVTGDLILTAIVQAIQANVKKTDIVGRWGGEEFGIVLPRTDSERAQIVADRVRHTLAAMPLTDDQGHEVPKPTVSQGIATYPTTAASAEQLIDLADVALYRAKGKGKDQVHIL